MSTIIRGATSPHLEAVMQSLAEYESQHSQAKIEAYALDPVSIRVRIVDPDFTGVSRSHRHDSVWRMLEKLPEEVQSDISTLLLLTPEEAKNSFANSEFDDPVRSLR